MPLKAFAEQIRYIEVSMIQNVAYTGNGSDLTTLMYCAVIIMYKPSVGHVKRNHSKNNLLEKLD